MQTDDSGKQNGRLKMRIRLFYLIDWLALNASFFAMHALVTHSGSLTPSYLKLLLLMNIAWLLVALNARNFAQLQSSKLNSILFFSARGALLMMFLVSLILVVWGVTGFDRVVVIGTYLLYFFLEAIVAAIAAPSTRRLAANGADKHRRYEAETALALLDLVIYVVFFLAVNDYKYNTLQPDQKGLLILGLTLGFWLLGAEWTGKFENRHHSSFFYAYEPFIKSAFIMAAGAALFVYSFELFHFSRSLMLAPVLLLLLAEAPLVLLWRKSRSAESGLKSENAALHNLENRFSEAALSPAQLKGDNASARNRLQSHYLHAMPSLFALLDRHCDLSQVAKSALAVLDTHTLYNIQVIDDRSLHMLINLHRVNDFRRINAYFLLAQQKLVHGGYFVVILDSFEKRLNALHDKYPKYMARFLYSLDFLVHRVMPKLSASNKLYFALWRGHNRALSKAELLGRLYFCGFRVLAAQMIDAQLFCIAQKDKSPNTESNPTYGPLVRLQRIGYQGRVFTLYKLRTMHPYSEFIQDWVYRHHQLDESGKFKDDFRVTTWGRLFRRFWIDELPQFVNYLRGDVKIFGVRALSEHYFSLYPDDVRALRIRFKPGLVPPYYADMPKTLEEIIDSERRYLQQKLEHPIRTDWVYFPRAVRNILFRHARSK